LQRALGRKSEGQVRANLCNADLSRADLSSAILTGANLDNADLSGAHLNGAFLVGAHLSKADLTEADMSGAYLSSAYLSGARLDKADFSGAKLDSADLSHTRLYDAKLNGAFLFQANLHDARLRGADLHDAVLSFASLTDAILSDAKLERADLSRANLTGARLVRTWVAGAKLAGANLTYALYAPNSPPPDGYVAQIRGLTTVTFGSGEEVGLVQLRDLLQKAGLRDLEREATFAIENGKTKISLSEWKQNPTRAVEAIFRYIAFDLTTEYGMRPGRALLVILVIWALLIPLYAWPIWRAKRPSGASSIYLVRPKDRVEVKEGQPTLDSLALVERLHGRFLKAIAWSAYFSLLSTFQIGFREFTFGTWLTRTQPRNFTLESTGWIRTMSGVQSLVCVYLLAMWLLTYFGRPFQ
jgi:uncharacterized protein YjbI with pentapeptide repeats